MAAQGIASPRGQGRPTRRRLLAGAAALAWAASSRPAGAILIQETTWRAQGFREHIALARQPQFAPLVAFSNDEGESWDFASGTWLGNFDGAGWVLTAAHAYEHLRLIDSHRYRTHGGIVRRGTRLHCHPLYNGNADTRAGYDAALLRLDGPVRDAGPPPLLFAREVEDGDGVVIVGFGCRGTGAQGERPDLNGHPDNKTAAPNTVDAVTDAVVPAPASDDAGNWASVTLHPEGQGGDRLDGKTGGGDSGGSVWMNIDGQWGVVGINVTSSGDKYGDSSYFARVSGLRAWMSGVLPGLRFVD